MILRLAVLVSLGCLAVAGPVSWDDSKCSQECNGGSKYQYSQQTSYIYSYESSNELQAERASELLTQLKATVTLTAVSKCEMVLQVSDVQLQHGSQQATSSSFIEELQRHPLPFSFNDGVIEHVCPNPEDSDEVNNIKKAIISGFQNTMRGFEISAFNTETDILGSCDTTYKSSEQGNEKFEILKTKNIPSCSNHLKGQTLLLASHYQSSAHRQHLPFLSNEKATCKQIVDSGIVTEVTCDESAAFKPLSDYGYVVTATGHSHLKKLSSQAASRVIYKAPKKESLVYKYQPHALKNPNAESDARTILQHICENSKDLITKEAASYVHKLVYTIRQMNSQSVENVYSALKSGEICSTGKKAQTIYLDALRMASSGGSVALLTKLATSGDISHIDSILWLTLMPFTSYVEEESISALLPLLKKDTANRQTILGITALAYKYCSINPDCESSQAIKDLSSSLKQFLGDKCNAESQEDEAQVLTALKGYGNLGYFGDTANDLFECALTASNKIQLRIAALDAFRRSPCSEGVSSKLLEIYSSKSEHDEVRMAALISLLKCVSNGIVDKVVEVYSTETSRQVEVFTWSLLRNLDSTSDPTKAKIVFDITDIKTPQSTDITKFSRNFESSFFSKLLNLGSIKEANIIHSSDSFLPRSANLAYKLNLFGNQLEPFEIGARVEDMEHVLEQLFGPEGLFSNVNLENLAQLMPEHMRRSKRSADSYQAKIDALSERLGYKRNKVPHATAFVRIMGHELGLIHLNAESLRRVAGIKVNDFLKNLASLREIDGSKNLLFIDVSVLFPSLTGRAYKLASNGSLTVGLKGQGKIDLRQPSFPIPKVDIDGKFQPSFLGEVTAAFTIHSDDFEPGVKVETVINAGLDYQAKIEFKQASLVHVKLSRERKRSEILNIKRTLYYMNHRGQTEMEKPPSHNLNYCTKYLQRLTGAKLCASLTIPHAFTDGKFKIPFVREFEHSVVVEQTDSTMDGYEFFLEIPEIVERPEKRFKILLDTPNSSEDRKLSLEINMKRPDESSCSITANLHTPIYSLEVKSKTENKDDRFYYSIDASGDGKRSYSLIIDAAKVVKGARLVEYQPKITISMPSTRPVELTGTIVFSKGRKAQITVSLESSSFTEPFTIKGNLAKEGENIGISSNWKLNYDFNANAFSQIHRVHGAIGYQVGNGLFIDMGHHFEPDGRSYESITLNAKVENIKILDRLSFSIDSKILFAEHQDLNTMLKWDFSFKPLHHLKNDLIFRYGENFEDDTHLVRLTVLSALHGDFNSLQKLNVENKVGLTISCLDFDKSATLSAMWDFVDDSKLSLEAGVKTEKDKQIKMEFNYRHLKDDLNTEPLKIATDFTFTYNNYQFKYRDEATEVSPRVFQWKSVIEPSEGKEITTDFMYRIKSEGNFHHELDGNIQFPGLSHPVKQKGLLMFSSGELKFNSHTDLPRSSYTLDVQLQNGGTNEVRLNTPFVEGSIVVDAREAVRSVRADFKSKGKDSRRILVSGSITPGDTNTLDLEVQWDADKDSQKKVNIQLTSNRETEDGVENHIIGGSVNYAGSINVDISGTINTDLLRGPHFFRAEFSGNMEPMAIEIEHEIKDGYMNSVTRYLRSGVEKIRQDIKGTFIYRPSSHIEIGGGLFTSSPYKTFDGKMLTFRVFGNSNNDTRTFISEYKVKFSPVIGYEGKLDYERKRGWPGHIRSNLRVTVHNRPMYEGSTHVDYGNGKYSWKTSFTPITRKKFDFLTSFEHSARFVAFHHTLATSLQYLQTIDLNAVADLRNMEDAKIHTNMDLNTHKLYDVNSTLKMRSVFDFDAEARLFSKITPSLKVFSKAQSSGQITKYEFNLEVDSKDIITGSGELKKRKRGFNGDIVFKYKEKEILVLTLQQDGKGKHERNYLVKLQFPSRLYTANVKVNKEQKGLINYETRFCRNEDLCVDIDVAHKEYDKGNEWQITYRRGDIEFAIERIRESTKEYERFHTVIYKEEHRYGYDVRLGTEGPGRSLSLGIILPSREIVSKATVEFSLSNPRIKLELSADGRNHPERKLITDVRFENHLRDSNPSKIHITLTHQIFEKPIQIELSGDYEPTMANFFTAEGSLDYSNDPDDKLIGKLSLERLPAGSDGMLLNIYHRDEDHLDFVIKANDTYNSNEMSFAVVYNWKDENNADEEAYMVAKVLEDENRFSFEYRRPQLTYSLEGKMSSSESLLNDTCMIDLVSVYNGEPTKGKLVYFDETGCFKLTVLNEEEVSRIVEVCINPQSRKALSVLTESFDDEGHWTFDYLMEIVQKDWNTIGFRQQMNPEFIGATLFRLTSFLDELDEAGVGSVPFYDSPRFKIIRQSFSSKVLNPAKQFILPEAQKFVKDVITDITFLRAAAIQYYNQLPSFEVVVEKIQEARAFIRYIAYEIWTNVQSYYESYVRAILDRIDKIRETVQEKCRNSNECKSLVSSYQTGGWKGLLQELRALLLSLPGKIEKFIENPGEDFKNNMENAMNALKTLLEPLTKYRCGEIVVKVVKLSYEALEPPVRVFFDRVPVYYRRIKDRLSTNEYFKAAVQVVKEGYLRMRKEILSIDYKKLVALARVYVEDYLSTLSPPSKKSFVTVNAINIEKGVIDIDFHSNVINKIGNRIGSGIWLVAEKSVNIGLRYNWNTLLIKFKRGLDLNFIPPYDAQAVIVGHQHFVTFDKVFYDFAGECSYLLSRDFEDGNFTLVLKPKEGDQAASILVFRGEASVELSSGRKSVKIGDNTVELPYFSEEMSVTREGNTIAVNTKNGLHVKCNLVHQICTFDISGWYYGKTAGLLGTYNYEDHDEFKRPKGHIANSVTVFAKSWELKRGCKTNNLVPEVQINKNSDYYKLCRSHFMGDGSPLAACFSEVRSEQYFQLCLRHLASENDHKSAFCNVAAAYVTECEKNYVELNLPSKCLTCDAPDGSKLEHGDRKKFENVGKKSADTIFIIEDHECNKIIMSDLGNLARSVERELQNEGFRDNVFGVVGFGGDIGDPQIFTAKDKVLFGSRDINTVTERFKLESQKVEPSRAFEAMKHAVTHLLRSDTSKSFVLISCSACKYDYTSLQYPVVQQILLERGISLHVIRNTEIPIRKSSVKEKNIIGVDPDTVFHTKDVTQKDLVGEPDLRSQIVMPKDLCIALSQDVNGSFFSTHPITQAPTSEVKNWRGVFSRKILKSTQLFSCQWCDCTSTRDHLPNTVCQPCEIKRPRLPFSVGSTNAHSRTVEAFLSYLFHVMRE